MSDFEFDAKGVNRAARGWLREIAAALSYLLRLPRGAGTLGDEPAAPADELDNAHARRFFPLAAIPIACVGAVVFFVCRFIGLPPLAAALFATFALMLTTGLRAELMLATFVEGIASGRSGVVDPASRRAAIAEQRFGYYGVAALVFIVLAKVALWSAAFGTWQGMSYIFAALPAATAFMVVLTDLFRAADGERLGGLALREGSRGSWIAAGLAVLLMFVFLGFWGALLGLGLGAAVAYAIGRYCRDELGGLVMPGLATALLASELGVLAAAAIAR